MPRLAVIGAGWAGLAAAVAAAGAGHEVAIFEATRTLGGRARSLPVELPNGQSATLDNGQHILVGAYSQTLRLMREVGIDPAQVLLHLPLTLRFPDGGGLAFPHWPAPLNAAAGILSARGWGWRDKASLLLAARAWRRMQFRCGEQESVSQLCQGMRPRVMAELIEPLCVSALNTPVERASAQVFLRVMRDALFGKAEGGWRASDLLLPRHELGGLFPEAAARWLAGQGATVRCAHRVQAISSRAGQWLVDGEVFDGIVLACPVADAARLVQGSGVLAADWLHRAAGLRHEAIATVYAFGAHRLPLPMLALRAGPGARGAQFVFDRGQLGGPSGLLAFVVSASNGDHEALQRQVLTQADSLGWHGLRPVQTVVEKRATFACTPGLQRPGAAVAPGLVACGDYVEGPYPATLEGAVRSALEAVEMMAPPGHGL